MIGDFTRDDLIEERKMIGEIRKKIIVVQDITGKEKQFITSEIRDYIIEKIIERQNIIDQILCCKHAKLKVDEKGTNYIRCIICGIVLLYETNEINSVFPGIGNVTVLFDKEKDEFTVQFKPKDGEANKFERETYSVITFIDSLTDIPTFDVKKYKLSNYAKYYLACKKINETLYSENKKAINYFNSIKYVYELFTESTRYKKFYGFWMTQIFVLARNMTYEHIRPYITHYICQKHDFAYNPNNYTVHSCQKCGFTISLDYDFYYYYLLKDDFGKTRFEKNIEISKK